MGPKAARILKVAIILLGCASPVTAQTRPDFSGGWTMVPDPKAPRMTAERDLGPRLMIEHTEKTLTVTSASEKLICTLDGKETRAGAVWSKAKWDRERLIIELSRRGSEEEYRDWGYRLYLDGSGQLVVETWEHSMRTEAPRVVYRK